MDRPQTWTLIISCFAVTNFRDLKETWGFLRDEELVWDCPGAFDRFCRIAQEEYEALDMALSLKTRIAIRLCEARLLKEEALLPDPWGIDAKNRYWKRSVLKRVG